MSSITKINPTDELLAKELQSSDEGAKRTSDTEVTDSHANVQPGALVPHHVEEIQGHHVRDGHDDHEQGAWCDLQASIENAQVGTDDGEGDKDLQDEKGTLREGVEDGDKTANTV